MLPRAQASSTQTMPPVGTRQYMIVACNDMDGFTHRRTSSTGDRFMNSPGIRRRISDYRTPSRTEYENGTVPFRCSGWPPATITSSHATLEHDVDADIVVIGAGLAGASAALHLAERGVSVVVLEAAQPGNGASGRNAGHVQAFLDNLEPLQTWPGQGRPFIDFFIEHRNIVYDICRKHGIEADAVKSGMVEAAYKKHQSLEQKAARWKALGYDVDVVAADRLRELLGTDSYSYGLHWREGGRVNPYLFTNGMVTVSTTLGARVYGNSPALSCNKVGQRWRVATPHGSVQASKVLVCTNGHADNAFFPELARTSYPLVACAMATRPLTAPEQEQERHREPKRHHVVEQVVEHARHGQDLQREGRLLHHGVVVDQAGRGGGDGPGEEGPH